MKGHWKTLVVALTLVMLVVGAVVYIGIGGATAQAPAKTETLAKADHGSCNGHAEGSEACNAKHESGACQGHQAGEKGHSKGTAGHGHGEGSEACKAKHESGACKGHEAGEKDHTK